MINILWYKKSCIYRNTSGRVTKRGSISLNPIRPRLGFCNFPQTRPVSEDLMKIHPNWRSDRSGQAWGGVGPIATPTSAIFLSNARQHPPLPSSRQVYFF